MVYQCFWNSTAIFISCFRTFQSSHICSPEFWCQGSKSCFQHLHPRSCWIPHHLVQRMLTAVPVTRKITHFWVEFTRASKLTRRIFRILRVGEYPTIVTNTANITFAPTRILNKHGFSVQDHYVKFKKHLTQTGWRFNQCAQFKFWWARGWQMLTAVEFYAPSWHWQIWYLEAYTTFASWWFQPVWNISYSQNGNLPQRGVKLKNIWNHHLVFFWIQIKRHSINDITMYNSHATLSRLLEICPVERSQPLPCWNQLRWCCHFARWASTYTQHIFMYKKHHIYVCISEKIYKKTMPYHYFHLNLRTIKLKFRATIIFYNITIYTFRPEHCVTVDQSVSPPNFRVAPVWMNWW